MEAEIEKAFAALHTRPGQTPEQVKEAWENFELVVRESGRKKTEQARQQYAQHGDLGNPGPGRGRFAETFSERLIKKGTIEPKDCLCLPLVVSEMLVEAINTKIVIKREAYDRTPSPITADDIKAYELLYRMIKAVPTCKVYGPKQV